MKWIISFWFKVRMIFNMSISQLPRSQSNKFELDFDKIENILILSNDSGVPKLIVATGGDNNDIFYCEEYSAELKAMLTSYSDSQFIFSQIKDSINQGKEWETVITSIRKIVNKSA